MKLMLYLHLVGHYLGTLCARFCLKCKRHPDKRMLAQYAGNAVSAPAVPTAPKSRGLLAEEARRLLLARSKGT